MATKQTKTIKLTASAKVSDPATAKDPAFFLLRVNDQAYTIRISGDAVRVTRDDGATGEITLS